MMRSIIDGFLFCFSYFTVIPTFKKEYQINQTTYSSMLFFLPFIGSILGVVTLYLAFFLNNFFPPFYSIIVASILYLSLYGFLHLEAIADVIDAWMAKYSNKDIYTIMKEPQVGSIGAIGTFCFVLLKLLAIGYLLYLEAFEFFIVALMVSRLSVLFNLRIFNFHKDSIFAQTLKKSATTKLVIAAIFVYCLVAFFLIGFGNGILIIILALIVSALVLKILNKRFGFLNGDCIGSSIEITELILLNLGLLLL